MIQRQSIRRRSAGGFTMLEVAVAIFLAAVAGSILTLGTLSSADTTENTLNECIAMGMAQQLMDEVVGTRYCLYSATGVDTAHDAVLQPIPAHVCNGTRQLFTDNEDFNGFQNSPPVDEWGITLGTDDGAGGQRPANFWAPTPRYAKWQQQISVYYVSEPNWSVPATSPTNYRAVVITIVYLDPVRGPQPLATLRRVIGYVPPLF
jgi:type II secretory pathway pseudopilin PulG